MLEFRVTNTETGEVLHVRRGNTILATIADGKETNLFAKFDTAVPSSMISAFCGLGKLKAEIEQKYPIFNLLVLASQPRESLSDTPTEFDEEESQKPSRIKIKVLDEDETV